MIDFIYISISVLFFGICLFYANGCERLGK
jgi:hypothetical protein